MTALVRYAAAKRGLAEVLAFDEVKGILDKAAAVQAYAHQAQDRDLELNAAEIKFRAERRLGELLLDLKEEGRLAKGGQPYQERSTGSKSEPVEKTKSLYDLGIDKKLSSRAQKIAAMPAAEFESHLAEFRERVADQHERIAKNLIRWGEKAHRRAENAAPVAGGGKVENLHQLVAAGVRFKTILADPPWLYETWSDKGKDRSAIQHYDTQTVDEIKAMPVAALADDDTVLHLWIISTQLSAALEVITAWGFVYKKIGFIWNKTTEDGEARKMGNGKWTRDEAEVCLFATKGSPDRLDANVRQTFDAPLGCHSEKPEEFRYRIERLTAGPYLELYGRKPVVGVGWTVWDNQTKWNPPRTAEYEPSADADEPTVGDSNPEGEVELAAAAGQTKNDDGNAADTNEQTATNPSRHLAVLRLLPPRPADLSDPGDIPEFLRRSR
jgi:N6-adenosine-specific RNA methylase IME4